MTDDLVAFLRARLDEDEWAARVAKDAAAKRTHYRASLTDRADRELREVAAARQLVDAYAEVADMDTEDPEPEFAYGRAVGLGIAVRLLAVSYADHPDYREEWRP